jgi:hypothetical protein
MKFYLLKKLGLTTHCFDKVSCGSDLMMSVNKWVMIMMMMMIINLTFRSRDEGKPNTGT